MKYYFNKNYFDIIDNSEKAYWLGFIWADGYVCKRKRKGNHIEYDFKLSLSRIDTDHLEKFKQFVIEKLGNTEIVSEELSEVCK